MDHPEKPSDAAGDTRPPEWGSDVAAAMLRALGVRYVAVNPGASYRGFHDSLVNYLGNRDPRMLLCLHEDHAVAIAHGYAKATDEPMGAVLHSNVGLMHGLMGVYNAWCDRMPVFVMGATGPIAPENRRPWIDWIHTAKDQGALLRDFTKWDDEPRSPEGIVEAFLRGWQIANTLPRAPVYICLDAGLQEAKLDRPIPIPDVARYRAPPPAPAPDAAVREIASMLVGAKKPVLMMGRGSRKQADWDRRVRLAELLGARVITSVRERAVFPTDHPLHPVTPFYRPAGPVLDVLREADEILSLDWVDPNGLFSQIAKPIHSLHARFAHVSLDALVHKGWSMDYFGLPPADVPVQADADTFVAQLLPEIEARLGGTARWQGASRSTARMPEYSATANERLAPRDIEVALARCKPPAPITLAHNTIGWAGDAMHFRGPLDYLGHDGGAGLAAGPGLTIGAALALQDQGRIVVSVLGDGDFMQGASALWTAARYRIPALFIVSNNRSNFNDEIHQETIAKVRGRPVENKWIGQRIDGPAIDLAALAKAQGVEGEGPIENAPDLERAIERGLAAVAAGRPYLIDAHVTPGYANTPPTKTT